MNWDTVSKELEKPLSPDAVKPPPQGKFGEYVDALHVIREANRIFGFDGWSYEITRLELVSSKIVTLRGRDGPYDQERVGYLASVRVNVDGVIREGAAVGSGTGNPNSTSDHHEAAIKEAETDAMKRALRTFGNTFGLALYEKDKSAREVGYVATDDDINEAIGWIERCENLAALQSCWGNLNQARRHVAEQKAVIEAKDKRKEELKPKEAA